MKKTITQFLIEMNERHPDDDKGVFVMSQNTIRQFRKETKRFPETFLGHQLRTLQGCPDDKIYLMSPDEFTEMKSALFEMTEQRKKDSAKHINSNLRKL